MKFLTLIRHAKSENAGPGTSDADRDLTKRGVDDARLMGRFLAATFPEPGLVYASAALRARRTVDELLSTRGTDGDVPDPEIEPDLYLADPEEIWDFAYSGLLETDELWICAHDPGITEAVERFSGSRIEKVPTCGIARIAFEELVPAGRNGILQFFDIPGNHRPR